MSLNVKLVGLKNFRNQVPLLFLNLKRQNNLKIVLNIKATARLDELQNTNHITKDN